jgi:hypothetical protein
MAINAMVGFFSHHKYILTFKKYFEVVDTTHLKKYSSKKISEKMFV